MTKYISNFLKGFLGGIANIIPGVSGSALLVILGIYDKCIDAISNILKDFKNSVLYLFPIGLGILLGTFLFSNIIELCLQKYALETSIIFTFFMIGTLPTLFKKVIDKQKNFKHLLFLIISFLLGVSILFIKNKVIITNFNYNFIILLCAGFLLAIATIIPGISSTVLLSLINVYDLYLNAINTLNLKILIPIGIGLIIGFFLLSKLISYLLNNYYKETFYSIIGFVIATIPSLIRGPIIFNKRLIFSIILGIIFAYITNFISFKANK